MSTIYSTTSLGAHLPYLFRRDDALTTIGGETFAATAAKRGDGETNLRREEALGIVAGPEHAETGLTLDAALQVVVGHPRRGAETARLGAGRPLGRLGPAHRRGHVLVLCGA